MKAPEVLVTGTLWGGHQGRRSIGAVMLELIEQSTNELLIVAYRLTTAAPELMASLEKCLSSGCVVIIVVDVQKPLEDRIQEHLRLLLKDYPNLHVELFKDEGETRMRELHAKLLVSDRKRAVVGSANFTRNGFIENHEIALLVHGRTAEELASAVDRLLKQAQSSGVLKDLRSAT